MSPIVLRAQLVVVDQVGADFLVNKVLVGDKGIGVRNVKYTGYDRAKGYFEEGDNAGLGINRGVILSSGLSTECKGPNDREDNTSGRGGAGSPLLDGKLSGAKTIDAATLEFEFKPQTKQVVFNYIFSSEEYVEWIEKGFNDIFGFFVSGPGITGKQNVAIIPGTTDETSIDNVNSIKNAQYFIQNNNPNTPAFKFLQHDGQTVSLQAVLDVTPCEWYKIELAIADVGDDKWDSWVFLEAGSFKHNTGLGPDTTYCYPGFKKTLDAGHPDKKVIWSTGETTQTIVVDTFGTYSVEVFTACGSFTDEIYIGPTVLPIEIGPDTAICGNEIDLDLGVNDNRTFEKYLWSNGDTTPTLKVTSEGEYWLEVRTKDCPRRDTVNITAVPYPQFSLGNDTTYCGDFQRDLMPNITGDEYTWDDDSKERVKNITSPGWHYLTVKKNGCTYTDSIFIDQMSDFNFDIGPSKIEQCGADEVTFKTGIRDSVRYATLWSTGDTTSQITVDEGGIYSVTVKNRFCDFEDSDEVEIVQFEGVGKFFVPNAFTPNGDEINNTFQPLQSFTAIKDYSLRVYDLWGHQVYETSNPEDFWDGKVNGAEPVQEVYIWTITIRSSCLTDHEQHQSGTILILK